MADRRSIMTKREGPMLFPTTIAGSLPKPEWLAEPNTLWAPWKSSGAELSRAKRDATLLAVKLQEDSGVDIVTEGEQARQHFVHGFLEKIDGIDFAHKVEMGIRKDRYKAMVPQVVAPLQLKGRVHADEARVARTPIGRSTASISPTRSRWASARIAIRRWYRRLLLRCSSRAGSTPMKPASPALRSEDRRHRFRPQGRDGHPQGSL